MIDWNSNKHVVICGHLIGGSAIISELSGRGPDAPPCTRWPRLNDSWHVARRPPVARSHAARGRPRRDPAILLAGPRLAYQRAVCVRERSVFFVPAGTGCNMSNVNIKCDVWKSPQGQTLNAGGRVRSRRTSTGINTCPTPWSDRGATGGEAKKISMVLDRRWVANFRGLLFHKLANFCYLACSWRCVPLRYSKRTTTMSVCLFMFKYI